MVFAMTATAAYARKAREVARWRAPDGSVGSWRDDGLLQIKHGAAGRFSPIGHAASLEEAAEALLLLRPDLKRMGTKANIGLRYSAGKIRYSVPPEIISPDCVDNHGIMEQRAKRESPAMRLCRVAAYALRAQAIGGSDGQPSYSYSGLSAGTNPHRRSIFDEPLTVGEIVAALADPAAPLTDAEREAATAELFTCDVPIDESIYDEEAD